MKKAESSKQNEQIPASLLIEDLSNDDINKRINSVKNIKQIVIALGNQRTRSQFLNLLLSEVVHDDDEVLAVLVERLTDITDAMGGQQYTIDMLPLYEALIQLESAAIRDKANDKLQTALSQLDLKKYEDILMKFAKRLEMMDYNETRQALCRLICLILSVVNPVNQTQLLNIYLKAASEETLIARKYAAKYSKDLVQFVRLNEATTMKIVDVLFKDKEQSNKIYLIDTLIQLAKNKQQAALQPYLNLISYQFSWRIRYELISRVRQLAEVMDRQLFKTIFLPFFTKYLNDLEPEIRSIASVQLATVCEFLEQDDIVTKILPALRSIATDTQMYVRHAFAKSLIQLCPLVGKKHTTEQIVPKFLTLLKDEDSEVRLAVFKNIGDITKVIGLETLSQAILPALNDLTTHKSWRIRSESVELILYFCKAFGPEFLLNDKNNKMYLDLLRDKVFAVRRKAIDSLKSIVQIHGAVWFQKNLLPKIVPLQKINNYLHRQTFIFAAQVVAPLVSPETLQKFLLPVILSMTSDPVENIRYNSTKSLAVMAKCTKDVEGIKRTVKLLKDDKDPDVKAIAAKVQKQL